jgi:opacity protein-like surface antigen
MLARPIFALLVVSSVAAAPISAQVLGLPVVNNGAPTGLNVGADVGFANDAYGGGTAFGGHAALGIGFIGAGAEIATYSPTVGSSVLSEALNATLRLVGGPLVPFRITLQAGSGWWSIDNTNYMHVPVSIGFAATIPNPAFAIKPWIAPRLDLTHMSGTSIEGGSVSSNDTHFGISGGVDFALLNGLALRVAYDRLSAGDAKPAVLSLGVGFSH